ncbi:PEP-CTERM sorting domain-containing protein [Ideonella sp. BN130291]|uniref:PEP-CTERM sorting domain-containing protein n=1 Tax=Ideonella sp. BN130291 TaxID=3112940 RepID=UPI002E2568EB|nr:PEP-CTERM sorting domain-containing protein [Ideonella sp. BN130291]
MKTLLSTTALLTALCASTAVHAVESGSRITGMSFTVIDLDTHDGVDARLNFDMSSWSGTDKRTYFDVNWWDDGRNWTELGIGAYETWHDDTGAYGRTTGPEQLYSRVFLPWRQNAEISPNTQVTISLSYDIFGTAGSYGDAVLGGGAICPTATQGDFAPWESCMPQSSSDRLHEYHFDGSGTVGPDGFEHRTGSVSMTFTNVADAYARIGYYAEVSTGGDTISPVPEPETWTLMFAGLAAMAACRRAGKRPQR